jgi:transposase
VQQIHAELSMGMDEKEDRRGRPRTSRTEENIAKVQECINEDASQSLESIEAETGIPSSTVNRILLDDMGLQWKTAHWLPHDLSEDQMAKRVTMSRTMLKSLKKRDSMCRIVVVDEKIVYHDPVNNKRINAAWVPPNGDQPVVYRRTQFSPKTMVVAAMTFTGKVHVEYVERGQSINSDAAYIQFLRNVFHNFSRHRDPLKAEDVLLIHDNARVHVSVTTRQFLDSRGVSVINQPPYSPDTNALDRFGFRAVEEKRNRRSFSTALDVESHVTDVLKAFSSERLENEFHSLLEHLQVIIDRGGTYV